VRQIILANLTVHLPILLSIIIEVKIMEIVTVQWNSTEENILMGLMMIVGALHGIFIAHHIETFKGFFLYLFPCLLVCPFLCGVIR
jgi:hypothetical protein